MRVRCQGQRILLMMALISTSLLTACGSDNVHFNDDPVITSVNDREDISPPAGREFHRLSHHSRNFFLKQLRWGLDPVPPGPAEDVNRLGEVPSSSWYENRISELSPADIAAGPGGDDLGPEAYKPWTMASASIQQIKWLHVHPDRVEIRTISYDLETNLAAIASVDDAEPLKVPAELPLFRHPEIGEVVTCPVPKK